MLLPCAVPVAKGTEQSHLNQPPSHPVLSKVEIIITIIIIIIIIIIIMLLLLLIDVAIPGGRNVIKKDVEKIFKYKDLTHNRDLTNACGMLKQK